MCRSMADIQSATAEIRRGKKKKDGRKKETQGKNIMACPAIINTIPNQHSQTESSIYISTHTIDRFNNYFQVKLVALTEFGMD